MTLEYYAVLAKQRLDQGLWFYRTGVALVAIAGAIWTFLPALLEVWWGPSVIVLAPTLGVAAVSFAVIRSKPNALRERLAAELVDRLHRRWFVGEHGVMDNDYRVTLYIPTPNAMHPRAWKCIARSGTTDAELGCEWEQPQIPRDNSGPVVFVARHGSGLDVIGIPTSERHDQGAQERYRSAVRMSGTCANARSWPGCSVSARMFRATNGTVPAVIVVEQKAGLPIRASKHSPCALQHAQLNAVDADDTPKKPGNGEYNPLMAELELAAVVAAALWEG